MCQQCTCDPHRQINKAKSGLIRNRLGKPRGAAESTSRRWGRRRGGRLLPKARTKGRSDSPNERARNLNPLQRVHRGVNRIIPPRIINTFQQPLRTPEHDHKTESSSARMVDHFIRHPDRALFAKQWSNRPKIPAQENSYGLLFSVQCSSGFND